MNAKQSLTREASDGELLAAMAEDDDSSDAAFDIFYNRYFDELRKYTFRIFGLLEADRFDLVQETMLQAYRAAATFKALETSVGDDAEKIRRRTIAWLGKIAVRIDIQNFRRRKGIKFENLEDENKETEAIETPSEKIAGGELARRIRENEDKMLRAFSADGRAESKEREIMNQVLAELPERELEILLATFEEADLRNPKQHLSQEKIDEICERYKINSKNLKQIRYRAKKFVFEECLKRFETSRTETTI